MFGEYRCQTPIPIHVTIHPVEYPSNVLVSFPDTQVAVEACVFDEVLEISDPSEAHIASVFLSGMKMSVTLTPYSILYNTG